MMSLQELRDKCDAIIKEHPSWADCKRIGVVTNSEPDGWKDMDWLQDIRDICCDGQGMVAFELVLESSDYNY